MSFPRRRLAAGVAVVLAGSGLAGLPGSAVAATTRGGQFGPLAVQLRSDVRQALNPGETFHVTGAVRARDVTSGRLGAPVAATVSLSVIDATGAFRREVGSVTTDAAGRFVATVPGSATAGYAGTAPIGVADVLAVDANRVVAADGRAATEAGSTGVRVAAAKAKGLRLTNNFVSSVGWVKPGERYPFLVTVLNPSSARHRHVTVSVRSVPGMRIVAGHVQRGPTLRVRHGAVRYRMASIAAASKNKPVSRTLILTGQAKSVKQDPRVVWRDISATATLTYDRKHHARATSHGPRVIPPNATFDTARYGDRPFPVVPVDYADFQHDPTHPASKLDTVINGRSNKGSTFNLYQEMSLGQLYPDAAIPSAHIASATYKAADNQRFTTPDPTKTNSCHGTTLATAPGALDGRPRISGGWYQLPGQRDYYGDDGKGSALVGAEAGVGALQDIDSGCGPTAKLAYDAAVAADPDIDYSNYDTNKDGVVDFFEVIFQGLGGNGDSQLNGKPPYDNVWPHSSSLLDAYVDPATGLTGYISHDQLKDLEGRPLWYKDQSRTAMTTRNTGKKLKVFVRVGPYNVNPESAIDHASVISHEYGHSLGAPDYYSTGSRTTYGDFMLMAEDKSQNVSALQQQEWGWVVPREIRKGTHTIKNWTESKRDVHKIWWKTRSGKPYVLKGPRVHNALVYEAKLPGKKVIDPAKVATGATPSHLWWSGSGNDFGCPPTHGHNLDIALPQLAKLPPNTPVTLTFDSAWEIEWDFDYGFVMAGTRDQSTGKTTYTALPSKNNYTTPAAFNPNNNGCQATYGNGITGSSQSYKDNTQQADRVAGNYPNFTFVKDSYDLSSLAGKNGVLRFSYATDPGLAKAGWFIDDIKITANGKTLYQSNFEKDGGPTDPLVYNGGCRDKLTVADACTVGWNYVNTSQTAPLDHAYFLSLRDRSGFDSDGHGENDRAPIGFQGGLLLEYTDESQGYGNVGTSDPPAQTPLDAHPQPGNDSPNLNDATFLPGTTFRDKKWVDNYKDPSSASGNWELNFGCLTFKVLKMTGQELGPTFTKVGQGGDLRATVRVTRSRGCAKFNYGYKV